MMMAGIYSDNYVVTSSSLNPSEKSDDFIIYHTINSLEDSVDCGELRYFLAATSSSGN